MRSLPRSGSTAFHHRKFADGRKVYLVHFFIYRDHLPAAVAPASAVEPADAGYHVVDAGLPPRVAG
jgi:hypothetical protein